MINWKATRVGVNLMVKGGLGFPYRKRAKKAWSMSEHEFWRFQTTKFRHIYAFARERIPYYRNHPELYPPLPEGEHDLFELLHRLPVLEKMTVRHNNSLFWASPPLPFTRYHTTSGSTTLPLKLAATLLERSLTKAVYEEWLIRLCGKRYPRTLHLAGYMTPSRTDRELFWRDEVLGDIYLSIYSLKKSNRRAIVKLIRDFKPELMAGFPSAVHELATLIGDELQDSKSSRIAIVTAEILYPAWRVDIENHLCGRVFDYYSSLEKNHSVIECSQKRRHIVPNMGIIEIVDEKNNPVQKGEAGRVLVTGLMIKSMPLLRYELGDCAVSTGYANDCSCGLCWPTIGDVQGRSDDLIYTRDGRKIGLVTYIIARLLKGVLAVQLIQNDYEKFVCNIVKDVHEPVDNADIENTLIAELENRLQTPVYIDFQYLSEIPRTPRGKFKTIVLNFTPHD